MDATDRVIQKIYEAAVNPEYWGALGVEIADFVGAGTVHLALFSPETQTEYISQFPRGDPGFADEWLRDYSDGDFRLPRIVAKKPGVLLDERDYVSREEARTSPIHQELLPKYSIYNIIGANMSVDDALGWFGVSTLRGEDDLENERKAALARLTPHILQAYKITKANQDISISRTMSLASLDVMNAGVLLLHNNKLVHANRIAEVILQGGFLAVQNGHLVCRDPMESQRLTRYLSQIGCSDQSLLTISDYTNDVEYAIRASRPAPHFSAGRIHAGQQLVISIVETVAAETVSPEDVVQFCTGRGVSPAETAVLHAVLNSRPLRRFAADRGVSLDTVQKQLKSAMVKLGLQSQKKLFQSFERHRIFLRD